MRGHRFRRYGLSCVVLAGACGDNLPPASHAVELVRHLRTEDVPGCTYASPILASGDDPLVILATTEGQIVAYSADGEERWRHELASVTPGDRAWIGATPVIVDDLLVVVWQDADGGDRRHAHHAAVLDARTGERDPSFATLTFAAREPAFDGGTVVFNPGTAFSRSRLVAARLPGETLGVVYASFGNIQDIQPWHGWVFEVDLDRWRGGATDPIESVLLTTPETSCGTPGESGSDDMICGGGVWAPSGPTLVPRGDSYELWVPTGNGQLDLGRRDYANTIMRTTRGLAFDPGCDVQCAAFDPVEPDAECMASCSDLFIPRLRPHDPPLAPPGDRCTGKTFLECYAFLDLDLGASSPAVVEVAGKQLAVLPAKDGAVYLFDADHFGTMYDRLHVRDFCGSHGGNCFAHWAGTMVTVPVIVMIDGAPLVLIPTFYMDTTNPAGVVALAIDATADGYALRPVWSAPDAASSEARDRFREHTGRLAPVLVEGRPYAVIADPGTKAARDGVLYAIDARTGAIAGRAEIDGPGHKYIEPAVLGDRVFVTSCEDIFDGPAHLEIWDLARATGAR